MIKKGRGRPRQYPIVLDKGTPEQQLKRLQLVDGGNPMMSTIPLDILLERQMIHEDHHRAGMTWWMTFMRIYGKVYPVWFSVFITQLNVVIFNFPMGFYFLQ